MRQLADWMMFLICIAIIFLPFAITSYESKLKQGETAVVTAIKQEEGLVEVKTSLGRQVSIRISRFEYGYMPEIGECIKDKRIHLPISGSIIQFGSCLS